MSGPAWIGVAIVAFVVVAVAAFGAGGFVTTSTMTSSEESGVQITPPPPDGSAAIVIGKYQSTSGFSIFGWNITPSTWDVQVMFVPPAGCVETADDDVVAEGPCEGVPAEGRISGGGTDADGNRLWTVSFEVSEECFNALEYNDKWPTSKPECAAPGSE